MKNYNLIRLFKIVFIIGTSLSIYSYLLDCILKFSYAIKNPKFLIMYLIDFTFFHSWIFIIICIIYYLLFKNYSKRVIIIKICFALLAAIIVSSQLYGDDWSLIIGRVKYYKLTTAYCLAGLTALYVYEYKYLTY